MANEILTKTIAEWSCQDSVAYAPTGNSDLSSGTPTAIQWQPSLTIGICDNTDKVDLGATRPNMIHVIACVKFNSAPTAGTRGEFYWAPSQHSSAAVGNPGRPDGSDGTYGGDGGGTVAESVKQMIYIGDFVATPYSAAAQICYIGSFRPTSRYGQLVIYNLVGIWWSSNSESSVLLYGTSSEIQ